MEVNEQFEKVAKEKGFYSAEMMKEVAAKGSIQSMSEIPEDVKKAFVTARDIAPQWHIKMQAGFQKHCDASISKTMPANTAKL